MTMPENQSELERLARVEQALATLAEAVSTVAQSVDAIKTDISAAGKTNWNVVLTAAIVVMALYAAAINPLANDVRRQETSAARLADAVIKQNDDIQKAQIAQAKLQADLLSVEASVRKIVDEGSPTVDKRLAILEAERGQRK